MLEQRIQQQFFDSADLKYAAAEVLSKPIADAVSALVGCITGGGKVLACGNGGSAADAQHFAAEFVGRFERERPGLAAIALTVDTSILTAVGNDYGYEVIFAKQVEALGAPGDILLAMSTSGNSANVLAAVAAARAKEMTVIALTGNTGGEMREQADRDRRPHLRAARAHRPHPGSAPAGAALPVRRGRPATARRRGKHMTRFRTRTSASLLVAAAVAAATASRRLRAARRRRRRRRRRDGRDRPPQLGRAGRRRGDRAEGQRAACGEALPGDRGRINTTSYNRMVLLTGEVPTEADKTTAEQVVARIDNVVSVVNELTRRARRDSFSERTKTRLHHHQGQGQPGRRQGPVRELDQGRDRIAASST